MSDDGNFLSRWSRRKVPGPATQNVEKHSNLAEENPKGASNEPDREVSDFRGNPEKEPLFDLTKLPPIDSIVANTDIRPFLAPGVPPELTRAALRRAWTADPAIRDFVGLSENSWDFTKTDSMAGFGPLVMTDSLRQIVSEMFAHIGQTEEQAAYEKEEKIKSAESREGAKCPAEPGETAPKNDDSPPEIAELGSPEKKNILPTGNFSSLPDELAENIAPQHVSESKKANDPSPRRGHGSALPR